MSYRPSSNSTSTTALRKPVRLYARTAVVDLSPELMREITRLFGRAAVVREAEA